MTVTAYDARGVALGEDLVDDSPRTGCTILITAAGCATSIVWGDATIRLRPQNVRPGETLAFAPDAFTA